MKLVKSQLINMPDLWFRENTMDHLIFEQVWLRDEYKVRPILPFLHDDYNIVDIGAHAGYFTRFVLEHSRARVIAFEPHWENYQLAYLNNEKFIKEGRCFLYNLAVSRSDVSTPQWLSYENKQIWTEGANTGGFTLFPLTSALSGEYVRVLAVGLDAIIKTFGSINLLKIDAESGEWPALLTSKHLSDISMIVGEYHEMGGVYDEHDPGVFCLSYPQLTVKILQKHLKQYGFNYFLFDRMIKPHPNLGHFYARKEADALYLL